MKSFTVTLDESELGAITDALVWNVAKQKWLKLAWKDGESRAGHARRQEQAERVLAKLNAIWRGGTLP